MHSILEFAEALQENRTSQAVDEKRKREGMFMTLTKQTEDSNHLPVRPLLLTIPQVMECLSLGRNKVYDLIHKEGLPVKHFGRAVRIPYAALEKWLEQRNL